MQVNKCAGLINVGAGACVVQSKTKPDCVVQHDTAEDKNKNKNKNKKKKKKNNNKLDLPSRSENPTDPYGFIGFL